MADQAKTEQLREQPRCPDCGSKTILYRVRTDSYLCRRCGRAFPKNGVEKATEEVRQ